MWTVIVPAAEVNGKKIEATSLHLEGLGLGRARNSDLIGLKKFGLIRMDQRMLV